MTASASYSKEKVDKWVADLQQRYAAKPAHELVGFWLVLVVHGNPTGATITNDELLATWFAMSTWERANVLFGLIPIIEKCASAVAKVVARRARQEEEK